MPVTFGRISGIANETSVSGDVCLAIFGLAGVLQRHHSVSATGRHERVHQKEIDRMAVQVTASNVPVLGKLVFEHDIPKKSTRARRRIVRDAWRTRWYSGEKVRIYEHRGLADHGPCRIKKAQHTLLVAGEVCRKQRHMTIELGNAGPEHRFCIIERIRSSSARRQSRLASD